MKWTIAVTLAVFVALWTSTSAWAQEEVDAPAFTIRTKFFVQKGDQVVITARGTWLMGPFIGSCGSNGFAPGQYEKYNLTSIANHGALIGKIGDSVWYNIGDSRTIMADRDGYLTLGPNDNEQANNRGSLRVTITIRR